MRKSLLLFMLLNVKLAFGQLSDDFSDGNFSINPTWIGYTSMFYVNPVKQLQTSLSAKNQLINLVTPNYLALNAKWEFFIQLNFDPSTSNQARIYLIADQQDLNTSLNGYFVQIGEAGNKDSYDLYKQTGTKITKIIDGPPKARLKNNQLLARVRVTRNALGQWELFTDITGAYNFATEGKVNDLTYTSTAWFGIRCNYTATRSAGFIFDDFSVSELLPDIAPPSLVSAKAINEFNVVAIFSKPLEIASAMVVNNYMLSKIGNPNMVAINGNTCNLNFSSALPTGDYKLTVNNVKDLKDNIISVNNSATFTYIKPYLIKKGDVLISEVLANPRNGGVDFIEIYNNTNQILDIKGLQLANADVNDNVANIKNITANSVFMLPQTYWVLTTNPTIIRQQYEVRFIDQFVQMNSLPAYNNDKGTVILLNGLTILERFKYNEKMHLALLKDGDGVSLERSSFSVDANSFGNFKSAAQSIGFASPTYKNSKEIDNNVVKNRVSLGSKIFSPDGDGYEDLLQIDYRFLNNSNLATINIYSDKGILIRKLQRNVSIGTEGNFTWDGLNDNGQTSKIGIYIVKFDRFALNGEVETYKQTCVLAAKLN